MSFIGNKIKVTGLIVSRPISIILLLIYLAQATFIGWMIWRYNQREMLITEQQKKIEELQEKVKILDVIQKYQIGFTKEEVSNLTNVVYRESRRYSIDPLLIISMIISESTFKKYQRSDMGALGLMQIKPSTAKVVAAKWGVEWHGDRALHDPDVNIRLGTAYLFELIMKFKDLGRAITAYNLGETMTREYLNWGISLPVGYINKVKRIYYRLKDDSESSQHGQDSYAYSTVTGH